MDLAVAFPEYLDRLVDRNLSPRTIDKYRRDGTKMVAFFQKSGQQAVADVDRQAADAWVSHLATTLHVNTRRSRIAMAQGFFRDLKDRSEIAVNPFARYPRPKLVKRHQPFFPPHQAALIFANIDVNTFEGARLRLLLMLCYHAGLRLAEALALNWCDIDLVLNEISVISKGGDADTMPINPDLRAELSACYAKWASFSTPTSAVFVSRRRNRLRPKDVYPSLKKFGLRGMGQRLMRRSALTNLANAGVPFHVVSGYARHNSLSSLGPYVQFTQPQLQQASAALNLTPTTPSPVTPTATTSPVPTTPVPTPSVPMSVRVIVSSPSVVSPSATTTFGRTSLGLFRGAVA